MCLFGQCFCVVSTVLAISRRAEIGTVYKVLFTSDSVSSKTAIFPKKEGMKREIFNEYARGSSLREANV